MDDETMAEVTRILIERNKQTQDAKFQAWCSRLDGTHRKAKLTIKDDSVAGIELQPHRWLTAGLDIIKSAHVTSRVQNMDGTAGAALHSFLPYGVFISGVELFLKGMYLCRYPGCRRVAHVGYVNVKKREKYDGIVRKFGHNLPHLIRALRRLKSYRTDAVCIRFIGRVDALARLYYYPLYAADKNFGWANARYPKRFYNDRTLQGQADSLSSYPPQEFVVRLFEHMEHYLNQKWRLRLALMERSKAKRTRRASARHLAGEEMG